MAESLLVRKGGGGAKIEELIQSYTVATGETITAGTFVELDQTFTTGTATIFTSGPTSGYTRVVRINDEIVLIVYRTPANNFAAKAFRVVNNVFTAGSEYFIWQNTSSPDTNSFSAISANNDRALVYARISTTITRIFLLKVNTTTLAVSEEASIAYPSASYFQLQLAKLSDTKYIATFADATTTTFWGIRVFTLGTTGFTSQGSNTTITSASSLGGIIGLNQNRAIILFGNGDGRLLDTSGSGSVLQTFSHGQTFSGGNSGSGGTLSSTACWSIDTAGFFRIFTLAAENSTTVTLGNRVAFVSQNSANNSINNSTIFNNNTIYLYNGINTFWSYKNGYITQIMKTDDRTRLIPLTKNVFVEWSGGDVITPHTKIITIKNATTPLIYGLAKTSGTAGQTVEVFVNE
jgi:hypothetical protein